MVPDLKNMPGVSVYPIQAINAFGELPTLYAFSSPFCAYLLFAFVSFEPVNFLFHDLLYLTHKMFFAGELNYLMPSLSLTGFPERGASSTSSFGIGVLSIDHLHTRRLILS